MRRPWRATPRQYRSPNPENRETRGSQLAREVVEVVTVLYRRGAQNPNVARDVLSLPPWRAINLGKPNFTRANITAREPNAIQGTLSQ